MPTEMRKRRTTTTETMMRILFFFFLNLNMGAILITEDGGIFNTIASDLPEGWRA